MIELFAQHFSAKDLDKRDADPLYQMVYGKRDVRVIASKIPPRNPRWDLGIGRGIIEALFDGKEIPDLSSKSIALCFPERWVSPAEEANIMELLMEKTNAPAIYIVTGSPVILTDCVGEMCKVLDQA